MIIYKYFLSWDNDMGDKILYLGCKLFIYMGQK